MAIVTPKPGNQKLWRAIERFPFDDSVAERPFTVRLAQENQWSQEFTERAVEEYRKFLYLAVTCQHPVVPSHLVDCVWHLHLIYTRSYWDDLCRGVLGRPLHHHPAQGGATHRADSWVNYRKSLESYRSAFGDPPSDIWVELTEERHPEEGHAEPRRSERHCRSNEGCNCQPDDPTPTPNCPYCRDDGSRCNYCRCQCQ